MIYRVVFFFIFLYLFTNEAISSTRYSITSSDQSLRSEVKENLKLYLDDFEPLTDNNISYWKRKLIKQANKSLQALGYYNSKLTVSVKSDNENHQVTVDVLMGQPVVITQSEFIIVGNGQTNPMLLKQKGFYSLIIGSKFDHGTYEKTKSDMLQTAHAYGYLDAQWQTHHVIVDLETQTVQISLTFDTGQRYTFGDITIKEQHESNNLVLKMAPFKTGDFFEHEKISLYNIALNTSQYFTSAQAIPEKSNASEYQVNVIVSVINRPNNIIELSGGFSTDLGERASLTWTMPWLNQYGHSLTNEAVINRQEQSITSSYKVPHGNPNEDFTNYIIGWTHSDNTTNNEYNKYSLQWQRHQAINEDWKRVLLLKFEREDDEDEDNLLNLVIPGISYTRSRRQGGITPYWGDRQFVSLEVSNEAWASTSNFYKISMRSNWLRQFNHTHQFLLKAQVGYINADSIDEVPSSMRFFGGGDNNLRAYDFKSVSPLNSDGDPEGALTQALMTLEYSYPIIDKWRIATFYDVGYIGHKFFDTKYTDAGIGLRWETPVGLVRFDLAQGLNDSDIESFNRPFNFSLAIGLDL